MADKKIHYSTAYLKSYLNGELSDKEMQALEKAALEDPFLSDAIEGLEEAAKHSPSFESGVADLQKKLKERVQKRSEKKGILFLFPQWQVAASIVVLASLTILAINLIKQSSPPKTISLEVKKDTPSVAVPATIPPPVAEPQITSDAKVKPELKRLKPVPVQQEAEAEEDKTPSAKPQPAMANRAEYKNAKRKDSLSYVQGLVMDDAGKPIPFASVHLPGQDKKTVTDTNGYFKLWVENNKKDKEISINSIGYKPIDAALPPDSSLLKYKMEMTSSALNEVVVQGYGSAKSKKALIADTTMKYNKAQPEGWQSLTNYINANKKINSADSVLEGEEIISFVLNKKGNLSSFKVIQSISPSHDAEVIRLLKSGPKLQTSDGKKQKLQISIFFRI